MSDLLVSKTSSGAQTSTDSWVDVADLSETVIVGSPSSVLLMIAVVPLLQDAGDETVGFRFAVDDVREGPEIVVFKDTTDKGCGLALCWAKTGISGSTKFAIQWRSVASKHGNTDTGRVRSFQVIEITDASILVNKASVSADAAVSGFTDIVDLTDTKTVAGAGSILLLLGNMTHELPVDEDNFALSFSVAGVREGPEITCFVDELDEGCEQSMMWMKTGISGSTAFALQWDEIFGSAAAETARTRSFQVIEITANANLLTNKVSQAADVLTGSYTDVVGLSDTVTVDGTDSILLFAASVQQVFPVDNTGAYRFFESSTGEGPENYVFTDEASRGCGHSLYWAVTGKSGGSHTFSLRGLNVASTVNLAEDRNRSFCILELTVAPSGSLLQLPHHMRAGFNRLHGGFSE